MHALRNNVSQHGAYMAPSTAVSQIAQTTMALMSTMIVDVKRICVQPGLKYVQFLIFQRDSGVLIHETRRLSMSSSTFAHFLNFVVVVDRSCTHAPPYMHSLPFLDDVNFVFVFVVASLSVDRVSDQFLQCTRSIRWQLGLAFRFGKSSFSTLLR